LGHEKGKNGDSAQSDGTYGKGGQILFDKVDVVTGGMQKLKI